MGSFIDLGQVHWEFVNLSVVVLLELDQEVGVSRSHEVDGHTLSTETTGSTDTMDVFGVVIRHVVVDD